MLSPELLALLLLAVPLTSALLIAFFFRRAGTIAQVLSVGAAGAIALIAGHLIFRMGDAAVSVPWLTLGDFSLSLGFLINPLSKVMLGVVAFVGFLIHVFALGYMKGDTSIARFFGCMSFFMFSMLGIVLADNLAMLFIFWELVGVSSYLLIGYYLERPSAVAASNKAFITNRVGDFGFLIGIAWAWMQFKTLNLTEISAQIAADPSLALTGIALLLFCGAVGKSGQMPLHVWLPDAMEGPTPVSALIHAATMVAAGIYLLCRIHFMMTADALNVVLIVGVTTALYAGVCAVTQKDIKKILAYSTVSQLGYMVAAFALGTMYAAKHPEHAGHAALTVGAAAAMFHLTTHAFFKALLFLGAGSIIHGCHHEQNIFKMGGIAKKMPVTFVTFTAGYVALIGFPWVSGFWSKDTILYLAGQVSPVAEKFLLAGALLTAFYMTRLWVTVFWDRPKSDHSDHAHESPMVMLVPLLVLAVLAIVGGANLVYQPPLDALVNSLPHPDAATHHRLLVTSAVIVALGFVGGRLLYGWGAANDRLETSIRPLHALLVGVQRCFDVAYNWYVANVQQRVAELLGFLEHLLISGLVVRGSAAVAGVLGIAAKSLQTGNIHGYVYWFLGGLLAFWFLAFGF
ncbi:MAG: NADH-quinone oxidoreductase subunit L [Opitutaceae bacterium]|nr:NADH-quinone oxidoreductase subunit L [Opitutaceae bacterium]